MSRVKNPDEKKRLSLTKDHRAFARQGNKTFRKAWRLKKAKLNREFRRAGTVALAKLDETREIPNDLKTGPRKAVRKESVYSLAQALSLKQEAIYKRRKNRYEPAKKALDTHRSTKAKRKS